MTLEMFEKETYKFGFTVGEECGRNEAKFEIVQNALTMNLSIEQVVTLTGLSVEEIL